MDRINVRDYISEPAEREFIRPRKLNKKAAAHRYSVLQNILEEWFDEVNSERSDTRDIPSDLADMYEQASKLMIQIGLYERDIVTGNK